MSHAPRSIAWLQPGDPFPPIHQAWTHNDPAAGLLAAGGVLNAATLLDAYRQGIFPWFSDDQPILWWSTDPRMVLRTDRFKLHPSTRKLLKALLKAQSLDIRIDVDFQATLQACASVARPHQRGTWIVEGIQQAYGQLHQTGHAHSIEAWVDGECWGGLYLVNIGRMVYGESMFSHVSNGSKLALCALVALCKAQQMPLIDCQQETPHLASLGARAQPRADFIAELGPLTQQSAPNWKFDPLYWISLFSSPPASA